jgi:hypothetical protein
MDNTKQESLTEQAFPVEIGTMESFEQETSPRTSTGEERSLSTPVDFADAEVTSEEPDKGPRARPRRRRRKRKKRKIEGSRPMDMLGADVFDEGLSGMGEARIRWKIEKEKEAMRALIKKTYGCDQDPESRVTVFCPSQEELGNFDTLMARVIKASRSHIGGVPHVGVSEIRLPTSW